MKKGDFLDRYGWHILISFLALILILQLSGIIKILDILVNQNVIFLHSPLLDSIIYNSIILTGFGFALAFWILIILLLLLSEKWNKVFIFILGSGLSLIIEYSLKIIVQRIRPENSLLNINEFSFPSGHATLSAFFFIFLLYAYKDDIKNTFLNRFFGLFCILAALFVGFTRIYVNVHWLSDVLVGFSVGIFSFLLSREIISFYHPFGKNSGLL